MTEPGTSALYTALAYHRAWTGHVLDQAMTHIHPDIICHTPTGPINGAAAFRTFLGPFSTVVTRAELIAAFGDTHAAVLIHDLDTVAGRRVPTAEYLVIDNGAITRMTIIFDRTSVGASGPLAVPGTDPGNG